MSSSYRIPASSTDVFEFETVIEPTGAAGDGPIEDDVSIRGFSVAAQCGGRR